MSDNNRNNEERVKAIFENARKFDPQADPFMKSKVMAKVMIERERSVKRLWKGFAIFSPVAIAAVLFLVFFLSGPAAFNASVNSKVLVKIEIKEIKSELAFAQIELPDGVSFFSQKYPELSEKRELTLAVDESFINGHIPIVVKSESEGIKQIRVRFLDSDDREIKTRIIRIDFKSQA